MAILNVTLDSLKFANTDGFLRDFGTKKTRDQNGGSLTTRECNENVAKSFDTQRPFYVSEDSETSNIEFSASFVISNGVKLTLGEGSFPGVEVKILSGDNSAVIAGQKEYILPLNGFTKFFWTGTSWNYTSFSPTQTLVESINSNDELPIIQDGETKKVGFETIINNLTSQFGFLKKTDFYLHDNQIRTYKINDGVAYLFINVHVLNMGDVVLLTYYKELDRYTAKVIATATRPIDIQYTAGNDGLLTFKSNDACRGYLYEIDPFLVSAS